MGIIIWGSSLVICEHLWGSTGLFWAAITWLAGSVAYYVISDLT